MRDLLDTLSILTESTGLAGRKQGDKFKNSEGNEIVFNKIEFFPSEGGKLEPSQLDNILKQLPNVRWQNGKTSKTGGIALATFNTNQGDIQFGFFKDNIKPDLTKNFIPNEVDGYRFAGRAAEKVQSGLTPQDLLKTKRDNLTREEIVSQIAQALGEDNPLVDVARRVASGEKFPIRFSIPEGVSFTGFRDYFCEILQPMALQVGQYTGNAGEAAETFLDGSFADTLISFDESKNAGLSDSILTNSEGKYVKVSTKGGKGAEASTKNLVDSLEELTATPAGQKILEKHSESVELMREIQKQGQVKAPLYLGVKYNIITPEDADTVLKLRNMRPVNINELDRMNLSDNLIKLAKGRATDNPENVNLFYHLLASIATLAAIEVNDKTDFSDTAAEILNNGALVQVYTEAKQDKDSWILNEFHTIYPSKTIKGVYLSAGKNYYSTNIKGNYTFLIDKGTGPKKDTEVEKPGTFSRQEKNVDLAKASKQIAQGVSNPISMAPASNEKGVGREKRK